ncbi:MAG: SRPBCC family protein [Kofleriaceae bacterium]
METVTTVVPRDVDACWRVFTDVARLTSWVPGLLSAEILTVERGLPAEIHFELGTFAYTLVYTYDRVHREVHWQPKLGKAAGVTGFARFEPIDGGTRITYGLAPGQARTAEELTPLVEAFARRMESER